MVLILKRRDRLRDGKIILGTLFALIIIAGAIDTLVTSFSTDGARNYIPKFFNNETFNNSIIYNNGSKVCIGCNISITTLTVNGSVTVMNLTNCTYVTSNANGTLTCGNGSISSSGGYWNRSDSSIYPVDNNDSLMIGNTVDKTRNVYFAKNQIMNAINEPLHPGDSYIDVNAVFAMANFTSTQPSLSFNGFEMVAGTETTNIGDIGNINALAFFTYHQSSGLVGSSNGVYGYSYNIGNGTVTKARGMSAGYSNTGDGKITNGYGLLVSSPSGAGSNNNITNGYGIYIQNQDRGTNKYNLYSAGNATNYFGGNINASTSSNDFGFFKNSTCIIIGDYSEGASLC